MRKEFEKKINEVVYQGQILLIEDMKICKGVNQTV